MWLLACTHSLISTTYRSLSMWSQKLLGFKEYISSPPSYTPCSTSTYHIDGNFGGQKQWRIWRIAISFLSQNTLNNIIFVKVYVTKCVVVVDSPKFAPTKVSLCTIQQFGYIITESGQCTQNDWNTLNCYLHTFIPCKCEPNFCTYTHAQYRKSQKFHR